MICKIVYFKSPIKLLVGISLLESRNYLDYFISLSVNKGEVTNFAKGGNWLLSSINS